MRAITCLAFIAACGGGSGGKLPEIDAPPPGDDAPPPPDDAAPPSVLPTGTVTGVTDLQACPAGAPAGARCKRITVGGCTGIEAEPLDAIVAIREPVVAVTGTVVHFSGGGGEGFQGGGSLVYEQAGLRGVFIAWTADWEQTQSLGVLAGACRPATVLRWVFDEPTLHAGSRAAAFCGEGFSGGSGQLGYALAHYGLGDFLDYVNELSGPPFARIDLGCNGEAPATAPVCSTDATMALPGDRLNAWENIVAPLTCGSTGIPAAELARWQADSIAVGSVDYPKTEVQFYACTNRPTAVTAQGKLYFDLISAAAGGDPARASYHCYTQADGCQGEGLGTGARDAQDALIAGCVPHHQ